MSETYSEWWSICRWSWSFKFYQAKETTRFSFRFSMSHWSAGISTCLIEAATCTKHVSSDIERDQTSDCFACCWEQIHHTLLLEGRLIAQIRFRMTTQNNSALSFWLSDIMLQSKGSLFCGGKGPTTEYFGPLRYSYLLYLSPWLLGWKLCKTAYVKVNTMISRKCASAAISNRISAPDNNLCSSRLRRWFSRNEFSLSVDLGRLQRLHVNGWNGDEEDNASTCMNRCQQLRPTKHHTSLGENLDEKHQYLPIWRRSCWLSKFTCRMLENDKYVMLTIISLIKINQINASNLSNTKNSTVHTATSTHRRGFSTWWSCRRRFLLDLWQ